MESETFLRLEWRIENFSCWREELHGKCIEYKENDKEDYDCIKLHPKGPSGMDDRMVVDFTRTHSDLYNLISELHLFTADESFIYKQEVGPKETKLDYVIGFEEIVAQIRKTGPEYGDRLTIQLRLNKRGEELYLCTVLEVIDTTFKLDTAVLRGWIHILLDISYSDDKTLHLETMCSHSKDGEFTFTLHPGQRGFSVQTRMSLISKDGSLVRCEENEHLLKYRDEWMFSDSLTARELAERGIPHLLLRVRIITGNTRENYRRVYSYTSGVSTVPNYNVYFEDAVPLKPTTSPVDMLSKDLMCLYQDQDFSDLQLKCGDVSFPVHKAILSARSPVFKAILSSDRIKAASGKVVITNLDPSTLGLFLIYLYTGTVEELPRESALKLYKAADKYKVPSLKRECGDFPSSNASILNSRQIWSLANRHSDDHLTTVPHNFMTSNCFGEESSESPDVVDPEPTQTPAEVLSNDLMCLYQDMDFSDFQLKCGDVTFRVHRVILSARSPVLKTMLYCDMTEAASGKVDITDLDHPTLARFLIYLYTGAVEDLQCDRALKLYYAADKYEVPSLKRDCAHFLGANVSISNVCDILSLANLHNDDHLTSVSQNFMITNCNKLLRSKEWKDFMESEPLLAVKTLTQFSDRNSVSFTPLDYHRTNTNG